MRMTHWIVAVTSIQALAVVWGSSGSALEAKCDAEDDVEDAEASTCLMQMGNALTRLRRAQRQQVVDRSDEREGSTDIGKSSKGKKLVRVKGCITEDDHFGGGIFSRTAKPGTECVFGVDAKDFGRHCIMETEWGRHGWCWTNEAATAWGSCSASCPSTSTVEAIAREFEGKEEHVEKSLEKKIDKEDAVMKKVEKEVEKEKKELEVERKASDIWAEILKEFKVEAAEKEKFAAAKAKGDDKLAAKAEAEEKIAAAKAAADEKLVTGKAAAEAIKKKVEEKAASVKKTLGDATKTRTAAEKAVEDELAKAKTQGRAL